MVYRMHAKTREQEPIADPEDSPLLTLLSNVLDTIVDANETARQVRACMHTCAQLVLWCSTASTWQPCSVHANSTGMQRLM